jgi:photosystem II stability/assembly factor-like uncharacterized protein
MKMRLYKSSVWAKVLLLTALACLLVACVTPTGATATKVNTGKTSVPDSSPRTTAATVSGIPLKTIRMVDHSRGWALTDQSILKTSDGGRNWKDVTPPGSVYNKRAVGDFMTDRIAWVVSTPQSFTASADVLRTTDGGSTWKVSKIFATKNLDFLDLRDMPHFLTQQEGFLEIGGSGAAGSQGASIFHTMDGGQNWTEISSTQQVDGLPFHGRKTGISFKDHLNGWATGDDASNTPWLYVTHNGGHTWAPQCVPIKNTQFWTETTPPVFFGNNGFLPLHVFGSILILKSTDGGATWTTTYPANPHSLTTFVSDDVYIATPLNAWASDKDGNVYGTKDGAEHWSLLAPTVDTTLKAFSFTDASYGWAIGSSKLWQTTDGGRRWTQILSHILP